MPVETKHHKVYSIHPDESRAAKLRVRVCWSSLVDVKEDLQGVQLDWDRFHDILIHFLCRMQLFVFKENCSPTFDYYVYLLSITNNICLTIDESPRLLYSSSFSHEVEVVCNQHHLSTSRFFTLAMRFFYRPKTMQPSGGDPRALASTSTFSSQRFADGILGRWRKKDPDSPWRLPMEIRRCWYRKFL